MRIAPEFICFYIPRPRPSAAGRRRHARAQRHGDAVAFKGGPYSYLNKQIVGVIGAAFVAFVVSRIDLEYARRHVWLVGGVTALLLIMVTIPGLGISVKGSRRWLGFGPIRFQVSELGKIAMVFCLAHYLALNQTRIGEFKRGFVIPLGLIGAFAGLVVLEPDFGTAALMVAVGLLLLRLLLAPTAAAAPWRRRRSLCRCARKSSCALRRWLSASCPPRPPVPRSSAGAAAASGRGQRHCPR